PWPTPKATRAARSGGLGALGLRDALPEHLVSQLLAVGAQLAERRELGLEDRVGVRALVFVERTPVGDDRDVVVGVAGAAERTFLGSESREAEHLAGDEPALVAAVGLLDDVAHLADRELDVVDAHAGL